MPALTATLLTVSSFLLTGLVVSNAYYQKKQFYPTVVYISKSQPSMAVFYLQALVLVALLGRFVKWLFFGTLRASESENLMEKAWYAVTETCLAFTVFRDDFNPRFVAQFTLLLFLKCFHWLAEDRVDYMERSPVITLLFHARMMGLMGLLSALDSYFMSHAYFTTLLRGASVQIVFGFEYAILMSVVFHVAIKYVLHSIDLRNVHPWENKAVYLLHAELVIGFFRVVLYGLFVLVMVRLHTFPLFSIRPMYLTIRAFKKALHDVVMSRRAIYAMQHLFADATAEDLAAGTDNVCIVCREEMEPQSGAKRLPCGHLFHAACLRSWFQRQQTCPTCRADILGPAAAANRPNHRQAQQQQPQQQRAPAPGPPQQPQQPNGAANPATPAAGQAAPTSRPAAGTTPAAWAPPPGFPPIPPLPPFPLFAGAGGASTPGAPHLPFPPLPAFNLPFPPPPSFAGLSDDEVAAMEGTERAAVEARVTALRNIGTLLEAATVQLQQYVSTLSALTSNPAMAARVRPEAEIRAAQEEPRPSTTAPTTNGTNGTTSKTQSPMAAHSADSTPASSPPVPEAGSSTARPESPIDEDARQIRLRRLQALEKRAKDE